ncbi:SusC/RagA family TonB-linked outer membrane protein [Dinghuibacter silviterrae]|nr:SusC/RagA family TonB-linked outer membrane protein [Dinghuibacter silviterrae]
MQSFANKGLSQENITLRLKNNSYRAAFKQIEQQTSVHFLYNDDILPDKKLNIDIRQQDLATVMDELLINTSLGYKRQDKNLVIIYQKEAPGNSVVVKGKVVNDRKEPLGNVTVQEKGKKNGTLTAEDGSFSLTVTDPDAVLVFSYVGYAQQEVPAGEGGFLNVTLHDDSKTALNDIVVIGYGTVNKGDLTGAVASVKAGDLKTAGVTSVDKALQGKMAGVEVESAGGDPGSGMRILVRGVGTFNYTDPLYIVDGVYVSSISNLAPDDIASISVLKDASAAAIYGSRAANGVVLVTTKSGTSGKTALSFNAYVGVQQVVKKLSVLNAEQWANVSNAAHDNAGLPRLAIADNPDSLGAGTDWQGAIYHTAPIQNYELNISGGAKGSVYSVSGGYINQQGIVDQTGYYRYNFRAKSETTKGRFKIGETLIFSQENWNQLPGSWGGQGGNPVGSAPKSIPVFKIYDTADVGGYGGPYGPVVNVENPVAQLHLEHVTQDASDVLVNTYAQVDIIKGLYYKVNLGYTSNDVHNTNYTQRYQVGTLFSNPTNNITDSRSTDKLLLLEHTLNFNREFGKHNIQALAGYSYQDEKYQTLSASANGLPDGVEQIDAAAGARSNGGNANENTLLSWLGRVIYTYDQRYLLTASFRRDGSSRFSPSNRYGNFPSLAVGWNISNESFFSSLRSMITSWKVRGSYGVLGNQEVGNYQYLAAIASNVDYVSGSTPTRWTGAIQQAFADPNIKWETSKTSDVGTDMTFLNNRLSLTADYYYKKTSDLLLQVPIPGSAGSTSNPYVNAGSIMNKGIELALSYNGNVGAFKYNVYGTFATNKNKVLALGTGTQQIIGGQPTLHGEGTTTTQVGGEVGAFYLIKTAGIFNSQAEINAYTDKAGNLIQPNAQPGDIKFVDANGDGVISDGDKVYAGSPNPKFAYGLGANLAWKGFDFAVYFQGTYGNKIYNGFRMDLDGMNLEMNYSKATLNAWTPTHHTDFPRAVIDDPNYNGRVSDRFLENGSYLRCKTLQVGYNISPGFLQRASINTFRVYAGADNLFTVTKYSGFNPDLGRSGNIINNTGSILDRGVDFSFANYPLARTLTLGIQLSF